MIPYCQPSKEDCHMSICLILGHNGLVSVSYFSDTSSSTSVYDRLPILQEQVRRL